MKVGDLVRGYASKKCGIIVEDADCGSGGWWMILWWHGEVVQYHEANMEVISDD